MVTSVQVFGSPVILLCVYVYVGKCHFSGAERFKKFETCRAKCLKVREVLRHLNRQILDWTVVEALI